MPVPKPTYTAQDFWALPEGVRAELIDGELWNLASPNRMHQELVMEIAFRFRSHIAAHGGSCKVYPAPFAVNLFSDDSTFVEPDVSVICDRSKLSDRGCEGAPDLVVEVVSPSNPGMDYVSKLSLYRAAGVREYWICDPQRTQVLRYDFDSERLLTTYDFGEPVTSTVLPGVVVDFAGIVTGL